MSLVKKIINEEIKNILNESYVVTDDRFKFQQRLNNSSFYNYDSFTTEFDSDIISSDFIVTWKVSFWLNTYGIENFIIDVEKIEGMFSLELLDKQSNEVKQETQKNIGDFEWKFVINTAPLTNGGALYISNLYFDFKNKTCTINF